jgi:hypothetical protein
MSRRIPIALMMMLPLLYACEPPQDEVQEEVAIVVESDAGLEFGVWLDSTRATRFAPDRLPKAMPRARPMPVDQQMAREAQGRPFRVTHRGEAVSVAGKSFEQNPKTGRFDDGEEPQLWELPTKPGMVFFEVGKKTVGVRWADDQLQELPEGKLTRIHVDAVGGDRIVIAYYDRVGSDEALDSNTVECTKCPPRRVCSVDPACP